MSSILKPKYYFQFIAVIFFLFSHATSYSQVQNARIRTYMTSNVNGWYEYLPQGYNDNQTYPLIIFVHGVGELGYGDATSLPWVLRNGPPKLINAGTFPKSFTVNGQTFKFIILSPQFISWPSPADIQDVIDYALKNYRVNASRIYLTGLSMGGGPVWDYSGASLENANKIAAIVPVCGVSGPVDERISVLANSHLPIWATHNLGDNSVPVSNTIGYIDKITALNLLINPSAVLNPIAKKTIFPVDGHDAWTTTYDPAFKENNMNIYEWMLQYTRGATSTPPIANQNPTANAGSDQTITLPTNSITLAGSGTDPDGKIASYSWTKTSGPSQYNINFNNIYNPTISNLVEGTYTFRLTVTDNSGATAYDDINIVVSPAPVINRTPISNTVVDLPGKIESENFNNMFGVQNEKTSDEGGGQNVGWIDYGDWMDYNVNVATSGNYTVNFRVATVNTGQQLQLSSSDGSVLATVDIPQTGGFQTWKTVSATVSLKAGTQTLRISSIQNGWWNINWTEFISIPVVGTSGYASVPGKIEAENYNLQFGVITEATNDINGGMDVGWIELGDWMEYNVNVTTAGTYAVNFRVASPFAGQQLQLKSSDGSVLTTVDIPQTGGFQTWKTVSGSINLKAGKQTLRLYSSQLGWWNINWLEFTNTASSMSSISLSNVIPGKIESENFSSMFGVIAESTSDDGGGSDLGWIEYGDWFEYNVNVTASSNYTVNFRVASPFAGQQLQVKNASGNILATLNLPQTGGFQIWKTVSVPLYLSAGNQTLRIVSTQNGWWNINWMDFIAGYMDAPANPSTQGANSIYQGSSDNNLPLAKQGFSIYPNPIDKVFSMRINNNYTGAMNVQIVNLAGIVVKQYKLSKGLPESQLNLSVSELPTGTYYLKVQIGKWTDTRKLINYKYLNIP